MNKKTDEMMDKETKDKVVDKLIGCQHDFEFDEDEVLGETYFRDYTCKKCNKRAIEEYKLYDVRFEDDDSDDNKIRFSIQTD